MCSIVKSIMKKGVIKGKSKLLSCAEINELESLISNNLDSESKRKGIFENIIGINKRIDELIEKILTNPEIESTLLKILGKNYLLRHVSVRYNEANDEGLTLHQDSIGELSLMVLINDQPDGSTFFFPGSQLIPSDKHLAFKVAWNSLKLINLTKFFLTMANGNAGNYYYFLNRTWHGRMPGKLDDNKISLFFDFFPVSARRKDLIFDDPYTLKIKNKKITQKKLQEVLSRKNYDLALKHNNINYNQSLSVRTNSLEIIFKNIFYFIFLTLKLILLEVMFFPIRLKRILKL